MRIGKNELVVLEALTEYYSDTDTDYLHSYQGLKERVTKESPGQSKKVGEDLVRDILKEDTPSDKVVERVRKRKTIQKLMKSVYNISRSSFNQTINRMIDKGLIEPVFVFEFKEGDYLPGRRQTYGDAGPYQIDLRGYRDVKFVSFTKHYEITKLGRVELEKRWGALE